MLALLAQARLVSRMCVLQAEVQALKAEIQRLHTEYAQEMNVIKVH